MNEQIQFPDTFKWIIGLLLSIIAFFLVSTFFKVDKIDSNVQFLMVNDGVKNEQIKAIDNRLQQVEKIIHSENALK